jgi:hypothetical protein
MASFGPGRRSRSFAILDVAPLRLRLQTCCGLGLNQNLPFLDGHCYAVRRMGGALLHPSKQHMFSSWGAWRPGVKTGFYDPPSSSAYHDGLRCAAPILRSTLHWTLSVGSWKLEVQFFSFPLDPSTPWPLFFAALHPSC